MYSGRDDDGEGGDRRRDQSRVKGRAVDKLFVDQLHYEVSELELETLFSQVGRLAYKPRIWFDKSGRSLGKATVKYERVSDAVRAIELFDGCPAKGKAPTTTPLHMTDKMRAENRPEHPDRV